MNYHHYLGLDLSLRHTGIAIVNEEKFVKSEIIDCSVLRGMERIKVIRETIKKVLEEYKPELTAIENYAFGCRGRAVFNLGELGGVIRFTLYSLKIPYIEIAPMTAKKFLTGKGNAEKNQMLMYALKNYKLEFDNDNECDAFALALMTRAVSTKDLSGLKKFQKEVVKNYMEREHEKQM